MKHFKNSQEKKKNQRYNLVFASSPSRNIFKHLQYMDTQITDFLNCAILLKKLIPLLTKHKNLTIIWFPL